MADQFKLRKYRFDASELFELSSVGIQARKAPETAVHYGGWSYPGNMHEIRRSVPFHASKTLIPGSSLSSF